MKRRWHPRRWLAPAALLLALAPTPAAAGSAADRHVGLFGYLEFPYRQLAALPRWLDAVARIEAERPLTAACDADVGQCESVQVTVWRAKVHELAGLPPRQRLIEVNRFVNGLPKGERRSGFAATDRWATPLEYLRQGGRARDAAVMKFVSLRDAGVANEAMRIVVVYDALQHRRHAVLAVRLEDGTFILDTVSDVVQPAERVRYYVPYYSVNETTRWAHVLRRAPEVGG